MSFHIEFSPCDNFNIILLAPDSDLGKCNTKNASNKLSGSARYVWFWRRCWHGRKFSGIWRYIFGCVVPDTWKDRSFFETEETIHPTTKHHIPEDLHSYLEELVRSNPAWCPYSRGDMFCFLHKHFCDEWLFYHAESRNVELLQRLQSWVLNSSHATWHNTETSHQAQTIKTVRWLSPNERSASKHPAEDRWAFYWRNTTWRMFSFRTQTSRCMVSTSVSHSGSTSFDFAADFG